MAEKWRAREEDIDAIAAAREEDPFAVLGPHLTPDGWVLRAFVPDASIKKAIQLGGEDPQMEFAAALITLNGPVSEHQAHVQKAIAGAKSDVLLARNLSTHFQGPQSKTMTDMISQTPDSKVAQQ